jgi:hypothetical protein
VKTGDDRQLYAVVPIKNPNGTNNKTFLLNPDGAMYRMIDGIKEVRKDGKVFLWIPVKNFDDLFLAALMAEIYQTVDVTKAYILVRDLLFGIPGNEGFFDKKICARSKRGARPMFSQSIDRSGSSGPGRGRCRHFLLAA